VVQAVLDGAREPVRSLHAEPGTLTLFRGRYSLHCVTPVRGTTRRVNAVLAYASTASHRLTPSNRRLFYGADGVSYLATAASDMRRAGGVV